MSHRGSQPRSLTQSLARWKHQPCVGCGPSQGAQRLWQESRGLRGAALDESDPSLSRYATLSSYRAFLSLKLLICEMKLSLPPQRVVGRNASLTHTQLPAQPRPSINDLRGSPGRKCVCPGALFPPSNSSAHLLLQRGQENKSPAQKREQVAGGVRMSDARTSRSFPI